MIQVSNTGYLQQMQGFRGLIYGRAGAGKTFLSTTCAAPLIIATEPGLLSVRRYNIPFIGCNSVQMLRDVAKWLATSHEAQAYQNVFLDTLSETLEIILAEERIRVGQKEPRKAYNELLTLALEIIRLYRDLQTHHNVMFLAKQERVQDGDSGMMLYQPKFPGKAVGVEAPYFFDFVFHLSREMNHTTGQEERWFRTQLDNQYEAKDRSGMLLPKEPAYLDYIFRKIMGAV